MIKLTKNEPGSFRDPSGNIFYQNNTVFRTVNFIYKENYDQLMDSGLYDDLTRISYLIKHCEIKNSKKVYKIIKPDIIPFVSYPYEWCFKQLKEAALLTLDIQKKCLSYNMSLKDASAFNIQFIGKKPIFIDTLSFEKYIDNKPWIAYRQFCQHFLAPLALMTYSDLRLGKLLLLFLDGIPLDLVSTLLPFKSKINPGIFAHILLNSTSQQILSTTIENKTQYKVSKIGLEGIIENLISTIKKLKPKRKNSTWGQYYSNTNYQTKSFNAKKKLVLKLFDNLSVKTILDLGSNNGLFSEVVSQTGAYIISADYDQNAVEDNFNQIKKNNILPLVIDFINPSPNIGWANTERKSFWDRLKVDMIMMLATIHHLAIANNLPFEQIANLISTKCKYLIIEFIDKDDSQVKILLSQRNDIFSNYNQLSFETKFSKYFEIISKENIPNTNRILYLMKSK
jgi:ribosomal protein L11 methylase PrmA